MLKHFLIWITILCSCNSCLAEQMSRLYTGEIDVNNQSNATLQAAFQQGLVQVLTKVSGNQGINTLPKIKSQLNQAKNLVQSYNFSANPNSPPALRLTIQYDKAGILKILNNSGQAIWRTDRPLTLVLLSTDQNNIITSSDTSVEKKEIELIANERGLPIIFPLMDLEDQAIDLAKSITPQQRRELLQRYHADAILIGKITKQKTQSQIDWQYIYNQQPTTWQNQSNTTLSALDAGINQITNMLANQFSVIESSNLQSKYTLAVNNIENLEDYGKLVTLIKKNSLIDQYNIKDMLNDSVIIDISSSSDLNSLNKALLNSNLLTPNNLPSTPPDTLSYRWNAPSTIVINNSGPQKNDNTTSP